MYLLQEVLRVYRLQGVDINDKHIEIIIRQMLKKVKVEDPGDTELLPGELIDVFEFEDLNNEMIKQGKTPAKGRRVLLVLQKPPLQQIPSCQQRPSRRPQGSLRMRQ